MVAGFTIDGRLATGSFGTVYRAKRDGSPFAIKLVPLAPRGNREVDALRRMQHPNVMGFHGYGFWPDEQPRFMVLALELVEGRPLDDWALEVNPTALELVGRVLLPLALTLADVHAAGVVHRDVKEANILVRDSDGLPVLVDFGAAGLEGAPRLTQWMPPGTPEYRSPETLRHAREWEGEHYQAGPGEDLWALGIVTYILLTRTLPFGDRNDPGMVRAILEETPPTPEELNPCVPPALSELCMRMLEKHPEDRYADARALAEALSTEWAQADKSWRVPLFPGTGREQSPSPPPAPVAPPKSQTPRRWWMAGLVLAAAWGVWFAPSAQRPESPPPPPPRQATARQELAPPQVTGEVAHDAGPQTLPTPAPAARAASNEEPKVMKSKKIRSVAATTLLTTAAAACVGAGCASQPSLPSEPGRPHRPGKPPPPEDCPPGFRENGKNLGLHRGIIGAYPLGYDTPYYSKVVITEGDITFLTIGDTKKRKNDAEIYGKAYFVNNHVYVRFTRYRMPDGEIVPICMQVVTPQGIGIEMDPTTTPEKVIVSNLMFIQQVWGKFE